MIAPVALSAVEVGEALLKSAPMVLAMVFVAVQKDEGLRAGAKATQASL